jgi:hypothetical protein
MAETNAYDLPVIVGAAVVGLLAIGVFYYTARPAVAPPPPPEPILTPLTATAAPVGMVDTSGSGEAAQPGAGGPMAMGGGPTPVGGGPKPVGGAPSAAGKGGPSVAN